MALDNNLNLINQIVTASGLRGKDLEALKTRLSKMSEAELQRELSKALSGNNSVGDKGLVLERTGLTQPPEQSITQSKPQSSQSLVLKEQQSKEVACAIIDENLREAEEVFRSQHLGSISGAYDEAKDENDKLKTSNVAKVLGYQQAGFSQIVNAKNGKLTKREYYEENKQRIKDMILTRLNVFKTPTGITFLEQFRGEYSKDEIVNIVNAYIEQLCSNASMEKLKEMQNQFVSYNQVEEAEALINFINSSKEYHTSKNNNLHISAEDSLPKIKGPDVGIVPSYWDSAEPISFEEVYKLERGVEYSQQEVESYIQSKSEMENVISAFNKKQQFIDFTDALRNEDLSLAEKESKLYAGFAEFYALSEDGGLSQLQKIIDKSNLPIMIVDGKLNLEAYPDEASKIRALNQLLRLAGQEKEKEFEAFLGNATIEDYQLIYEQKASDVLGEENGKLLAEAMANDNMSMIQRYTGNTSMVGMGLTVVGGILCFTPAAPLGAVLVTAGNTVAIGGMVAKTGLGVTDYATKEVQTQEELENLAKDFVMDAGGFIIGMKAGQTGLKAFSKLIDKKLVAVFGEQVSQGNKLQALKTVFTTPEYLASFSKAAGAKISTDFLISYIGDLAMMGVLDTRDDWKSLLQANLTGILVGMSGDVKDVAGVGKVRHNLPETIGTKSRPVSRVKVTSDEAVTTNKNNDLHLENDVKAEAKPEEPDMKLTDSVTKEGSTAFFTKDIGKILKKNKYQKEAYAYLQVLSENIPDVPSTRGKYVETCNGKCFLLPDGTIIQRRPTSSQVSQLDEYGWPTSQVLYPDNEIIFEVVDTKGNSHIIAAYDKETCELAQKIFDYIQTQKPIEGDIRVAQQEYLKGLNVGNNPTQPTITERLATASAREDFVALRDEIKSMPEGAEKTALKQEYMRKYKEFSQMKIAENDIKMEAKPEEPANSPKLFTPEMSKEEVETLLNGLKNPDGSARFSNGHISRILEFYTPDKAEVLSKLLEAKTPAGFDRFDGDNIGNILFSYTPEKAEGFNKLLEAKNPDGSARFDAYHIPLLLYHYTPDKADVLNKLLEAKNPDGSARFDGDISHILSVYTPDKADALDKLLEATNPDGSIRFNGYGIGTILESYTPDKSDLLNKLLDAKYADGSIRFGNREIEIILQSCTPENVDVLNKLLEAKDSDGSIRFNGYHIKTILKYYTPDKVEVLNKLLEAKDLDGFARFQDSHNIEAILKSYTPDKAEILDKLLEVKNPNGSNRFVSSDIGNILQFYTPAKADAFNKLLEAKNSDDSARFDGDGISIILRGYTPNKAECLQKLLNAKNQNGLRFNKFEISNILASYTPEKAEILTRLLSETVQDSQGNTIPRFDADIIRLFLKRPELKGKIDEIVAKVPATEYGNYALRTFLIANKDIDIDLEGLLKFKDLDSIIKMIQNNPERYINGTETDPYAVKIIIDDFFRHFGLYLSNLNTVLDKEAMNTLLRTRLSNVQTYLYTTTGFSSKEWELLGKLSNSCNNDGKPFLPKQKIQFIDLIKAYKDNDVSFNKMEQMLETGNIDIGQLQIDLFQNVMRKSGLTEEEIAKIPNENLIQWDIQNIHLLAKSINSDKKAFDDIIRAANLEKDFVEYLHNADNVYGQANNNTQKMYADMKMDYDEWLHPSKNHEIKFTAKDKNLDKVQQIASQVEEDLNALMNTPVSGFLKKQFPKFIKDNKFVLPAEYTNNKAKLTEFVKLLADTSEKGQLAQVWKRAQGNSTNSNPEIAARANNTLTILNHLEQRVKDIESVQEIQSTKTLDITIKMWDRVPQKDLFQGNHSTCCIGMSDSNASAMPHFIMDTSYNMIELVDNNSGDVIGNALCYFVKGEDGKPAFIIDNIEINNAHKPSDEIGADLRDHIAAYAARVAKDVTGADNTPIYMSSSYNDVPISDLKSSTQEVSFLGDIDCDQIYMDLYKGWVDKKDLTRKVGLLKVEPALVKEDYGTNFAKRLEMGTIKPIPEGLLNVKISDVIVRDGDKVSLKPEYEKQLWIIAENIRDNALKMEDKIVELIKDNNFIIAGAEFKHRPKSLQSLYDKLKNYALEINKDTGTLKNIDKTLGNAKTSVKDAVGVRVIAPSKDYSNHPEVKALLAAGKKNEAIALATEMQSKEIVANLKRISEDKNHELKLINISNYKSKNGVPYAKAEDVEYLKYHGSDTTSKSGKDDKSIRDDLKGETKTESESSNNFERTKVRDSGYTALQFNFKIGDFIFEFQFRGKEVDEFAEGEHIPYDLRTGKDIIGKDTQLAILYEPMKELLRVLEDNSTETVGMKNEQYKAYEKYLSEYYEYLRAKELGIEKDKPKLTKCACPHDKRLMAENLIKLHEVAEKLKNKKITPTEALREYQSEMVELE